MSHPITFRASGDHRNPRAAIRHLYLAGMALPLARSLVADAELGGTATGMFEPLHGHSRLARELASSGYLIEA